MSTFEFWLELVWLWAKFKGKTLRVIEIFFTLHRYCTVTVQYWCSVAKAKYVWWSFLSSLAEWAHIQIPLHLPDRDLTWRAHWTLHRWQEDTVKISAYFIILGCEQPHKSVLFLLLPAFTINYYRIPGVEPTINNNLFVYRMTQRNPADQPEEEILSEAAARAALPPGHTLHTELPPPPPPPFPTLPLPLPPASNETMSIFVNEDR